MTVMSVMKHLQTYPVKCASLSVFSCAWIECSVGSCKLQVLLVLMRRRKIAPVVEGAVAAQTLPKDFGGPVGSRECMAIPFSLVGRDVQERSAGEFETKQLLTSSKPTNLSDGDKGRILDEAGKGFTLNPLPAQHLDLQKPLPLNALTTETSSDSAADVFGLLKTVAVSVAGGSMAETSGPSESLAVGSTGAAASMSAADLGARIPLAGAAGSTAAALGAAPPPTGTPVLQHSPTDIKAERTKVVVQARQAMDKSDH